MEESLSSLLADAVVAESTSERPATNSRRFGPRGLAVFVGLGGLAMVLIFLVVKGSLTGDAYIALAYMGRTSRSTFIGA